MRRWQMAMREPSLEELLADDIMRVVMRSAGLDEAALRRFLAELKGRLSAEQFRRLGVCSREYGYRPSAA